MPSLQVLQNKAAKVSFKDHCARPPLSIGRSQVAASRKMGISKKVCTCVQMHQWPN